MRKGDILLVKYKYDPIAWIIRKVTRSNWNHVCWILDDCHILEIKSGNISRNHIRRYLNKKFYEVKLVRIKGLKKEHLKLAMDYGMKLIKKGNYFS